MPTFDGVHHVTLTVTDFDRSVDWYRRVLGLDLGWDMPDTERRGRKGVLLVPGTPVRIVLALHASNEGESFSEFRTGLDHVAWAVEDRAALDGWVRHLDELGVDHSPVKEGATGWLITFRDPDNIQFELYSRQK